EPDDPLSLLAATPRHAQRPGIDTPLGLRPYSTFGLRASRLRRSERLRDLEPIAEHVRAVAEPTIGSRELDDAVIAVLIVGAQQHQEQALGRQAQAGRAGPSVSQRDLAVEPQLLEQLAVAGRPEALGRARH